MTVFAAKRAEKKPLLRVGTFLSIAGQVLCIVPKTKVWYNFNESSPPAVLRFGGAIWLFGLTTFFTTKVPPAWDLFTGGTFMQIDRYVSHSPADTERFARQLAQTLSAGDVVALCGGLGMGKTAFVRGLAQGLEVTGEVSSPTFALVHEHPGRLDLYHFDM